MTPFGTTATGQEVDRLHLSAGDLSVSLITLGAIVQSVRLAGVPHDLTLGSDRVADYEGPMRHHGSLIGPVANRFTDAVAPIAGIPHRFEANQDGRLTLHSGAAGTHLKVWDIVDHGPAHATLRLTLPDGEGGFPGRREVTARFDLLPPATLRLTVTVTTDARTLVNFTNHSYWNLDGTARWDGHRLRIAADHVLPTTPDFAPTGEIADVAQAGLDFREGREITVNDTVLDHNFCLADARGPLRDVLWLTGKSGVTMTLATTEPGVQVYDGRNGIRPGHAAYEGLAIEAQGWPDAPNHACFPSIELAPDEIYEAVTEWRFKGP